MQHRLLFTIILLGSFCLNAKAQEMVGINTTSPEYSLDVHSSLHCFGHFTGTGYAGVILDKGADNANEYVIHRSKGVDRWSEGTIGNNNFSIRNWFAGGNALTINSTSNFIGLGVTDPAYRLDVAGRMRLRAGTESAGLWLNNNANTVSIGFLGVYNDNHIGLWGNTGIGWSVVMNTDNGYLGIKNGDPKTEFHVIHGISNGASYGLRVQNSGPNNQEWTQYVVNTSGNLELYHNGNFRGSFDQGSGAYTASSDARFKRNIHTSGDLLDDIMKLDVKRYQFITNQTGRNYYGFLAQDVEKIFPEVVFHNQGDDGSEYYSMDYSAMGVIAIKGVQELKLALVKQQREISELEQQNKILQTEMDELKKLVKGLLEENKKF